MELESKDMCLFMVERCFLLCSKTGYYCSPGVCFLWLIVLTMMQHSQKKRHIAGQYANTNIMHLEVIGGK